MNSFLPTDPTLKQIAAAICANSDEDTPRLLYADRLDELAGAPRKCVKCKGTGRFTGADKKPHRCGDCGGSGKSPNPLAAHAAVIRSQIATPLAVKYWGSWHGYTERTDPESVWTGRVVVEAYRRVADPRATGMLGYPGPPVRGFPEFVCAAGAEWLRVARKLVGVWPLRDVSLASLPPVRVECSRDGAVCRVRWYGKNAPGWQDYTGVKGMFVARPGRTQFHIPSDLGAAKWLLTHTRGWERIMFTCPDNMTVDTPDGSRPLYEAEIVDDDVLDEQ